MFKQMENITKTHAPQSISRRVVMSPPLPPPPPPPLSPFIIQLKSHSHVFIANILCNWFSFLWHGSVRDECDGDSVVWNAIAFAGTSIMFLIICFFFPDLMYSMYWALVVNYRRGSRRNNSNVGCQGVSLYFIVLVFIVCRLFMDVLAHLK